MVRFDLTVKSNTITIANKTKISSGYQHQCDPVAFVNAPAGLVYDKKSDVLYVASTMDNAVYAVSHASSIQQDNGPGTVVFSNNKYLHGALGMSMTPNGTLIISNNDAINFDPKHVSELTEITTQGNFVKQISVDTNLGGAFGLAVEKNRGYSRFAAVDDNQNILFLWKVPA